MRDSIHFLVNGQQHRIRGADAFLTLADFLRKRLGLCGTKVVCSEGDCGSCTVLVGSRNGDRFEYRPIDSCIRFVFQLDGTHVVSVEGLAGPPESAAGSARMNSVQQAMIDCHGSQCGFCTPGFVVAMTGLLEHNEQPSTDEWRTGLTGNLCRCTGYSPIFRAGEKAQANCPLPLNEVYDAHALMSDLDASGHDSIEIIDEENQRRVFCPGKLTDALVLMGRYPDATIVAGATDIGVQVNKRRLQPVTLLDLNRIEELLGIEIVGANRIHAGARATWAELAEACRELIPEFHRVISVFGSPQIRHVATIGGNIINASPIADSIPLLMVSGATLVLASAAGSRCVDINDFYRSYKKFDLKPGELLTRVEIPLLPDRGRLRLYKVSRRRDLDIASFTAAVYIETDEDSQTGGHNGRSGIERIVDARIAFGAVGPVVLRLRNTERFLLGQPFSEHTMKRAADCAAREISPISDVRGSDRYRLSLARNVLVKFFHQFRMSAAAFV